jgi:patatin-like phospholipase/acyl hydrolase
MKPFRKNVAIAIDGGGIRGIIITQALSILEAHLNKPVHDIFRLAVGTSTGSIISAAIASGITANSMTQMYKDMATSVFPNTLRKILFPLTRYRYSVQPFIQALNSTFGSMTMGDYWRILPPIDLVITTYDLEENRTRFIKPWKDEYEDWLVSKAVQASCTVPTYFPILDNRYIDGGVGSYANPCYIAAYEAKDCLNWNMDDTTLISIGSGRDPYANNLETVSRRWAWDWIGQVIDVFMQSAYDEQVHLVDTYFKELDFRRFQINLRKPIEMDDTNQIDRLVAYGSRLGRMILNDQFDSSQGIIIKQPENL